MSLSEERREGGRRERERLFRDRDARTRSFSVTTSEGAEEVAEAVGDLDLVGPSYVE